MKPLLLAVALSLPVLAQGPPSPPVTVLPDVGALFVYASDGKLAGSFVPTPAPNGSVDGLVRMEVFGEGVIYLPLSKFGATFVWNTVSPEFMSLDCTGPAFVSRNTRTIGDRLAAVGMDGRLYIGAPDAEPRPQPTFSRVTVNAKGERECIQEGGSSLAIELREVANLNTLFPPPLSLNPGGKLRAAGPR